MNLRYGWPLALLAAGCAGGAPLETDSAGTGGATVMMTMTGSMTTTSSTTVEATTTVDETTAETTLEETTEGSGGSTGTTTGVPEDGGELYPIDQVQSPITPAVAESMLAIAGAGPQQSDGVFAKVGSSSTASANFLNCFADPGNIAALDPGLMEAVTFFNTTMVGMMGTSFNRTSVAAMADWTALEAITGMPSPIADELAAISPRFAVVLFGTKELEQAQPDGVFTFADNLLAAVDQLTAAGTIPILSTLPTRTTPPETAIEVPRFNAVIRAIAQGYRVPLVDLNLALAMLPSQGLAPDGIDLGVYTDPNMVAMPCNFDPMVGGPNGYNTRNLVTLQALDRARKVVVGEGGADSAPLLEGAGTLEQPFVIPGLPFSDFRSTADSPSDSIDMYAGGCQAVDESGPEYVYELTVAAKTTIRAMVFDRAGTDVDIHLLTLQDIKTCVRRDDRFLAGPVEAGTYYLAVDTLGGATPGDFALVVLAEG